MMSSTDQRANVRTVRPAGDRMFVRFGDGVWMAPAGSRFKVGDRVRCWFAGEVILVNDNPAAKRETWTAATGRS
jgi:hypothetical protein